MTIFDDAEAERTVLSYILSSTTAYEADGLNLKDVFTVPRNKTMYDVVGDHYAKTAELPDPKALEDYLTTKGFKEEQRAEYLLVYQQFKSLPATKGQFTHNRDQLKKLYKKRTLFYLTEDLKKALAEDRDPDDIRQKIDTFMSGDVLPTTSIRIHNPVTQIQLRRDEYVDREKFPDKYRGIPTGFKRVDEITGGTFPEELSLIFARSGDGKTRTLFSIAYNGFVHGYNYLYVTIEMPGKQVDRMFDSRAFRISSTGLRQGKLSAEDKKKFFAPERASELVATKGDFTIVDVPEQCSVATLAPIIRQYKAMRPLHGIIFDYANLMAPTTGTTGDLTKDLLVISRELKLLARKERVCVWSAVQATRSAAALKVEEVGSEHIGYSDATAWNADMLLFLRKDPVANQLQKTIDMKIVKFRDGAGETIKLGTDFDRNFVGDMDTYLQEMGLIVVGA